MNRRALAVVALLSGCGYAFEAASRDEAAASCAVLVTCFDVFEDVETCLANTPTETAEDCPDYDPDAARDCVASLEAMVDACPEDIVDFDVPAACDRVCAAGGEDLDTDTAR